MGVGWHTHGTSRDTHPMGSARSRERPNRPGLRCLPHLSCPPTRVSKTWAPCKRNSLEPTHDGECTMQAREVTHDSPCDVVAKSRGIVKIRGPSMPETTKRSFHPENEHRNPPSFRPKSKTMPLAGKGNRMQPSRLSYAMLRYATLCYAMLRYATLELRSSFAKRRITAAGNLLVLYT